MLYITQSYAATKMHASRRVRTCELWRWTQWNL